MASICRFFAACKIVEVEPTFTILEDGTDPIEFMLRSNVERRHLNKGQCAIAAVRANRLLNNQSFESLSRLARSTSVSKSYIAKASIVEQYANELGDEVLAASLSLENAYLEALHRRHRKQLDDEQADTLRIEDPKLFSKVKEGTVSLNWAWSEYNARLKSHADTMEICERHFHDLITFFCTNRVQTPREWATPFVQSVQNHPDVKDMPDKLDKCIAVIKEIAEGIRSSIAIE
jgi:predicted DNA-binding protein